MYIYIYFFFPSGSSFHSFLWNLPENAQGLTTGDFQEIQAKQLFAHRMGIMYFPCKTGDCPHKVQVNMALFGILCGWTVVASTIWDVWHPIHNGMINYIKLICQIMSNYTFQIINLDLSHKQYHHTILYQEQITVSQWVHLCCRCGN